MLVLSLASTVAVEAGDPPPLATLEQAGLVAIPQADGSVDWRGRCGTPRDPRGGDDLLLDLAAADCTADATFPDPGYDPGGGLLIDVWVPIIEHRNGNGVVPDSEVHDQIAVLNEDFRALLGTPGASGNDARIFFRLAGTTRTESVQAYNDSTDYWTDLAVDPHNFLNIYTNSAGGYLGYAYVPQTIGGSVGDSFDRVVIYWEAFGRDNEYWIYDEGRTTTHEVGHHLGLFHTFDGCDAGSCNTSGDLLCDTAHHSEPDFDCVVTASSCAGNPNTPIENYMNYTPDLCMDRFTVEQRRRMRCTLDFYRPDLGKPVIFYDGFENGTGTWSDASG
jgi:hypothetical protein